MLAQEHAAEAVEKFNAGQVIIEHVSNSSIEHPLIHLPTLYGIDFSVTKHVLMLWLVALTVFVGITWTVRRYLRQDRPVPLGFMNVLEAAVRHVLDDDLPRVEGPLGGGSVFLDVLLNHVTRRADRRRGGAGTAPRRGAAQ